MMLGPKATEEAMAFVRARYGLDQPIYVQYLYYLWNVVHGDFGQSLAYRGPVAGIVVDRLPVTIFLLVYGFLFGATFTTIFAVSAARNEGRWPDQAVRLGCIVGLGLPSFWIGIMLILLFSLELGLFPVSGFGRGFIEHLHHLFLPALTIGIIMTPILTRNFRATLLNQLDADYVTAGRSRGMPERQIFYQHVMRNSLLPTLHLLGITMSFLIGGTVVVETVFAVPGLGQLMVKAILARDYFVVQAVTLVLAVGVVGTNFIVDVLTVAVDPRVRM
jgi:peptide/nickel transport system permease protein